MNKERKRFFALFIIGTFLLSTIAFVITGLGSTFFAQNQQPKVLTSFILSEDIDQVTEQDYVGKGYTFLKYYYNEQPPAFLDALPDAFRAGNDVQLFVVKIQDSKNYARIVNVNNYFEVNNLTEDGIISELCNRLMVTPVECSLRNIQ